jgi:hypothetical protein
VCRYKFELLLMCAATCVGYYDPMYKE